MKKIFAIAASALVLAAPAMSAQGNNQEEGPSSGDIAAYFAINFTTVGALPPLATNTLAGAGGIGWHLQYGRMNWGEDVNTNAIAGGVDLGLGSGRLSLTAGYHMTDFGADIEGDSHLMIGTRYSQQLAGAALNPTTRWAMGLEADLGFGFPEDVKAMVVGAGLPVKLTFGRNVKVSPFVTPGFGYGRLSAEGESESGTRFMVGAGLGLGLANGVGVNFGMRKAFIEDGKAQYGLGVTIRPGK